MRQKLPKPECFALITISLAFAIALATRLARERDATLDCRAAVEASFCAVRVEERGFSVQWGEGQRTTFWVWGEEGNWRVWPEEK